MAKAVTAYEDSCWDKGGTDSLGGPNTWDDSKPRNASSGGTRAEASTLDQGPGRGQGETASWWAPAGPSPSGRGQMHEL